MKWRDYLVVTFLNEDLKVLWRHIFFHFFEFGGWFIIHNGITKFSRELYVSIRRTISNFGIQHIDSISFSMWLWALLAFVSNGIFLDFLFAIWASYIEHLITFIDKLNLATNFKIFGVLVINVVLVPGVCVLICRVGSNSFDQLINL